MPFCEPARGVPVHTLTPSRYTAARGSPVAVQQSTLTPSCARILSTALLCLSFLSTPASTLEVSEPLVSIYLLIPRSKLRLLLVPRHWRHASHFCYVHWLTAALGSTCQLCQRQVGYPSTDRTSAKSCTLVDDTSSLEFLLSSSVFRLVRTIAPRPRHSFLASTKLQVAVELAGGAFLRQS